MKKFVFNEAVYTAKLNFIQQHCMHISQCKGCSNYNPKTGCKDPAYIKERLMTPVDMKHVRPKVNHVSCSFDHSHGKYRVRLNTPDLGQKTVCFVRHEVNVEAVVNFIRSWDNYIDGELEYSKMKNGLEYFRKGNDLK